MFMRTRRLFLRPIFPEDWPSVFSGVASKEIVRNLARAPWPYGESDARNFCAAAPHPGSYRFAITLPEEAGAPLIGCIGLDAAGDDGLEIGYWIAQGWQGRGFATEAASGVVALADAIGFGPLVGGHFLDNPASGRVLRKIGFVPTGEHLPCASAGRGGASQPTVRYRRAAGAGHGSHPAAA